jgi:quercetin dioxygenase-like cupin family protein
MPCTKKPGASCPHKGIRKLWTRHFENLSVRNDFGSNVLDFFEDARERGGAMKVIRIEELPEILPPKHYDLVSRRVVDASIGAKAMGVSLVRLDRNGRADPHIHENAEQLFIVFKGEMAIKTEQEEVHLKQGEAAFIYPGERHQNVNVADGETEYIVVTSNLGPSPGR